MGKRRPSGKPDERVHFIVDASAAVPFFYTAKSPDERRARATMVELLKYREERRVLLHIPDFCMAECSKAFARIAFAKNRNPQDARDEYRQKVDALLDVVSSSRKGLIRRLGLTRKHLVDIEDVFLAEYDLKPRDKNRLSGLDALIIAMAKHHARQFGQAKVYILTGDRWLADVCRQNQPDLPRSLYVYQDRIPEQARV